MWWALPVATGIMGHQQAKAQNRAQRKANMAAATQTEWSPWTGMGQGEINTQFRSPLASGLQGGLTGFMQAQGIQQGLASDALKKGAAEVAGKTATEYGLPGDSMENPFGSGGLAQNTRPGLYKRNPWDIA